MFALIDLLLWRVLRTTYLGRLGRFRTLELDLSCNSDVLLGGIVDTASICCLPVVIASRDKHVVVRQERLRALVCGRPVEWFLQAAC